MIFSLFNIIKKKKRKKAKKKMFSKRTRAALKAWGNKELEMLPHNISRAFICLYFINHGCTHLLDHWLVVNKF